MGFSRNKRSIIIIADALFWSLITPIWGWFLKIRKVKLTEHIVGTAGDQVAAEIEYRNPQGKVVGFWAYGHWHPLYPYKGQYTTKKRFNA